MRRIANLLFLRLIYKKSQTVGTKTNTILYNSLVLAFKIYIMFGELGKDEFKALFGRNLKRLRESKNLSFRKLAQRCDIDYSNLNKIEKGKINISLSTILELSKGLDVHPRELFNINLNNKEC